MSLPIQPPIFGRGWWRLLVEELLWTSEPWLHWYIGRCAELEVKMAWRVGIHVPGIISWGRIVACFWKYNSVTRQLVYCWPREDLLRAYASNNNRSGST